MKPLPMFPAELAEQQNSTTPHNLQSRGASNFSTRRPDYSTPPNQQCGGTPSRQCDFILITGDAYVDHPSFGAAVIGRVLEASGFTVGIIAQPAWQETSGSGKVTGKVSGTSHGRSRGDGKVTSTTNPTTTPDILRLGLPRLAFLVTAGNMDSMVAHFSSTKRRRKTDAYTPRGVMGKRPDRATLVYAGLVRQHAPGVPLIIGGIEASLRRFGHYDYWSNKMRRSILLDSRADILVYGMGEQAIRAVAKRLQRGEPVETITNVPGTVIATKHPPKGLVELPSFASIAADKKAYAQSYHLQEKHTAPEEPALGEWYDNRWVVQNPPQPPLTTKEMDSIYSLPFTRQPHPSYTEEIPALREVSFSIIASRGCFGGCSFCALRFHQGRVISSRSKGSIIYEAKQLIKEPNFKGYIHDIGGPTANFYSGPCNNPCTKRECLFPKPCPNLQDSQTAYFDILRAVRNIPRVKKVFVRSGIRYDYLLHHNRQDLIQELCEHHVSGQLKIAPEHVAKNATTAMRKPDISVYQRFVGCFAEANKQAGKKQFVIPYLISGHPGTTLEDALEMALFLKQQGFIPDQVQDFYPTPGTRSTAMYYTGLVPETLEPIHIPKEHEKHLQRGLVHFHKPENRKTVLRALKEMNREELATQLRPFGKGSRGTNPDRVAGYHPKRGDNRQTQGSRRARASSRRGGQLDGGKAGGHGEKGARPTDSRQVRAGRSGRRTKNKGIRNKQKYLE